MGSGIKNSKYSISLSYDIKAHLEELNPESIAYACTLLKEVEIASDSKEQLKRDKFIFAHEEAILSAYQKYLKQDKKTKAELKKTINNFRKSIKPLLEERFTE